MQWILTANNTFSIKSYYVSLNDGGLRSQLRNNIWKSSIPLKIKVFAGLVTHGKVLSRDSLARKGWTGPLHCVFCRHDLETTTHLFLHCPVSLAAWDFFLHDSNCINNIPICDIFSMLNLDKCNLSMHGWNMLVLTVIWCLWLKKNSVIFRNQGRNISSIFHHILSLTSC